MTSFYNFQITTLIIVPIFIFFITSDAYSLISSCDLNFFSQITDLLFRANGPLGQDLVAKDIQRGRDMGIPSYNHFRSLCGFAKATSFDELRDVMDEDVRNTYE